MTRLTLVVASLVVSLTASAALADDQEPEKEGRSVWMKQKLDRSKDILEGLSQADFDKVAKAAQAMRLLTRVEAFARGGTPGYRKHLESFEDAADEIFEQANDDNLEGVALAFHELTNSCVTCHKQLRKSKPK